MSKDLFADPSRDEQIASGEIEIVEEYTKYLNVTEAVQLCKLKYPEAGVHLGMSLNRLLKILKGESKVEKREPIDRYRKLIKAFLKQNWKKVRDQVDPKCNGNCNACNDIVVLSCYITNHKWLRQFIEERK